ncbi:MAG: hypothetical protein VKO64_02900 [Candidatus Sericytochromatia bacterium]|nr:hypothetical protein [Candidatus Sericytochromatia bacterium]
MRRALAVVPVVLAGCTASDGLKLVSPSATTNAPVNWEQLAINAAADEGSFNLLANADDGSQVEVKAVQGEDPPEFRLDQLVLASTADLITDATASGPEDTIVFTNAYRPGSTYAYRYTTSYEHKGQAPAVSVLELGAETSDLAPADVAETTVFTSISSKSVTLALKPCTSTVESSCSISGVVWFTVPADTEAQSLRLYLKLLNAAGKAQAGQPSTALPVQAPVEPAPVTPPAT